MLYLITTPVYTLASSLLFYRGSPFLLLPAVFPKQDQLLGYWCHELKQEEDSNVKQIRFNSACVTPRAVIYSPQEKCLMFRELKIPPGFPSKKMKSLQKNKDEYQEMAPKQQQHNSIVTNTQD